MFRGNHPARVDEKGRLKVPAEFKRQIDEGYSTKFYITSKDGEGAEVYPFEEWQRIEEKISRPSNLNPAKRKFLNKVNYYGQMAELDAQGRLLLPQIRRESAGLMGDVTVFGNLTYLEVRNRAASEKAAKEEFTAEDAKTLEELG